MTWLAWRQFRMQALAAALGLAVLGAFLLITGPGIAEEYADGLATCGDSCRQFQRDFTDAHQGAILGLTFIVIVLPGLIGVFWGAPLLSRELEAGTHRLAWHQSVSRVRWMSVKLVLVGLATAAVTATVLWSVDRWSQPVDAALALEPRMPWALTFAARGVVPVAYALFAVVLGVVVGMLLGRSLPAMVVTLAVFGALQVAVPMFVRPHLAPVVTDTVVVTERNLEQLSAGEDGRFAVSGRSLDTGAWTLDAYTVDASGHRVEVVPVKVDDPACRPTSEDDVGPCLEKIAGLGYRLQVRYHPANQFWRLQWTEAGVYTALTAGLVAFGFFWIRRRVA